MLRLLILTLLVSCSAFKKHKEKIPVASYTEELENKYQAYIEMASDFTAHRQGWFDEKCDNLLFTSLVAHIPELGIDIMQAYDGERWHRRPNFMPECYPDDSKSTISRDMLLGVMVYAWRTKDIDILDRLAQWGRANNWKFGDGEITRTVMSPQMVGTLYLAINILNDENNLDANTPLVLSKTDGYQAHLSVIHALLRADMLGYAPNDYLEHFKYQAERQPQNPLFQYAVAKYTNGDFDYAQKLIIDTTWWPSDRLPTYEDRCSPWILERDYGESWQPCDSGELHSGYDFIFVADLILRDINR